MTWLKRIVIVVLALLLLLVAGFVLLGFIPAAEDPLVDPRQGGAGASSVEPSWSGLQREFPPIERPEGTPATQEAIELGRLLFFDPILSGDNQMSCATCHHPDLGFADGKTHPVGVGGQELPRHTPTLWNVAWAKPLFWDGRAETLEDQAATPLTHPSEMASDPDTTVAELQDIPAYVALFQQAFPDAAEPVTFDNLRRALAAFERTLISNDSAFDRFAAGDVSALTESQKRGLNLFRSAATRCFECHTPPLFTNNTFRALGVPEEEGVNDPGRPGVASDAPVGSFRVPTLRNVALTAPYMHNGALATLEDVVDFYAKGGGHQFGNDQVDRFLQGFDLSEQEQTDLVAFLHALTDESQMPEIPDAVPSGLAVVARLENPARQAVGETNVASVPVEDGPPRTLTVHPGENIQAVVDKARPGDTVEIEYGVYNQNVVVNVSDVTLRGIPNQAGEWPILDGQGQFADGVLTSGNNFLIEQLQIKNYTANGVLAEGVRNVTMRDIYVESTGVYGLYPVHSSGVLIERAEATGVNDAGIYVGQSEDIIIRDSVAYGNVIGIEVENSVNAEVYNNHTYDNSTGIFFDLLPNLTSKVAVGGNVHDNLVENNNHANFARPDMTAALLPSGIGVLLLAVDEVDVHDNTITGNNSAGVAVFRLTVGFDPSEIDVPDRPERNWIHDNQLANNGNNPDAFLSQIGVPGADLLWDGSAWSNRFDQPGASRFPPLLPSSNWPTFLRKGYWQVLNFAVERLF
jgi:parallel beta-helix repeat protein